MRSTSTASRETFPEIRSGRVVDDETRAAERRLATLISLNSQLESQRSDPRLSSRRVSADGLTVVTFEQIYSYLGFAIGLLVPSSIFLRLLIDATGRGTGAGDDMFWLAGLMIFSVAGSTAAGYFSGKLIGKIIREVWTVRPSLAIPLVALVGILWGMIVGGAGGVFLFIIGSVFGSVIGGMSGFAILPIFFVIHKFLLFGIRPRLSQLLPWVSILALVTGALILGS